MSDSKPRMGAMFGGETDGGFFDLPRVNPHDDVEADIAMLRVPAATPYRSVGNYCAGAPDAIRSAFGWPGVLDHHDFDIDGRLIADGIRAVDCGNLGLSEQDFAANRQAIRDKVSGLLTANAIPLVLGGDDSVPIPVLEAYRDHGPLTILQLDAHIDWRDEVGGERFGLSSNMRRASEMPWVERIIQVGARGIGSARPQDHRDALDWGVHFFPMRAVVQNGLEPITAAIPEQANLYIALDIDVMDPAVVPAVIGPAPGGFSYWQMLELLEKSAAKSRICGFNLAELMTANDIGGRGALVAARLVAMEMGLTARQRVTPV